MQLVITIITFLVIDGLWIYFLANPLYKKHLPESFLASPVRIIYALAFYLLFSFALWFLFIRKTDTINPTLLFEVFLFGFTAYGTFALTNMAVIREWNLWVTIPDLVWGGVLSVLVTFVTLKIAS